MTVLAECPICHRRGSLRKKTCKCGQNMDKAKKNKRVKYWVVNRIPGTTKIVWESHGDSLENARAADAEKKVMTRP